MQAGFTLLEVLVALAILALCYATILQILGGAAKKASISADYRRALIVAESRLDYAAANLSAGSVATSGVSDERFRWTIAYQPTSAYLVEGLPTRYTPVEISVQVEWDTGSGRQRAVSLSTLRLARGQAG